MVDFARVCWAACCVLAAARSSRAIGCACGTTLSGAGRRGDVERGGGRHHHRGDRASAPQRLGRSGAGARLQPHRGVVGVSAVVSSGAGHHQTVRIRSVSVLPQSARGGLRTRPRRAHVSVPQRRRAVPPVRAGARRQADVSVFDR
eukprot:ctg_1475.g288